jgi:hypothetical protein
VWLFECLASSSCCSLLSWDSSGLSQVLHKIMMLQTRRQDWERPFVWATTTEYDIWIREEIVVLDFPPSFPRVCHFDHARYEARVTQNQILYEFHSRMPEPSILSSRTKRFAFPYHTLDSGLTELNPRQRGIINWKLQRLSADTSVLCYNEYRFCVACKLNFEFQAWWIRKASKN